MTRPNSVGPGGILTFLTIAWFTAGGVALALFAVPGSGPLPGLRALVARTVTGG